MQKNQNNKKILYTKGEHYEKILYNHTNLLSKQ